MREELAGRRFAPQLVLRYSSLFLIVLFRD
jgi:hypothetical protein